jgi:NADH-quinone oxidoreductase subunit A
MLKPYLPVLFILGLSLLNAVGMLATSHLASWALRLWRKTPTKLAPYESGMPVLVDSRERFSVKFYLVAVLFIIFDVEAVFLIPWAAAFHQLTPLRGLLMLEMVVFMAILVAGYVYVWKRGALEWD